MALSDDLRERVVEAVVVGGLSRNAAAKRFGGQHRQRGAPACSASAPAARFRRLRRAGDRRSGRIEGHRDYLLGFLRRRPTLRCWRSRSV